MQEWRNSMNLIANQFVPLNPIKTQPVAGKADKKQAVTESVESSFQSILEQRAEEVKGQPLKFSKHANERLNSRNIQLSNSQMNRLETGVEQAREKKIKDSLVMVDDLAFIVNVKNNVVVTAMNQEDTKEQIFTNIDGAVIM